MVIPKFQLALATILFLVTSSSGLGASGEGALDKLSRALKALPQQPRQQMDSSGQNTNQPSGGASTESGQSGFADTPTISSAAPDVMGARLGISGPAEVRDALSRLTPPLSTREKNSFLEARTKSGRVVVPGSEYVGWFKGEDACPAQACTRRIFGHFLSPPMEPKLFYVVVTNTYSEAAATSLENMVAALEKKYGGPPYETAKGQYSSKYLHWAWAPSGDLIALSEKHPCAQRQLAGVGADASPTGLGGVPQT